MRPSTRSLQMRRNIGAGILRWSLHYPHDGTSSDYEFQEAGWAAQSMGIRNAARALGVALNVRLRRHLSKAPFLNRSRINRKHNLNEHFLVPEWAK